jgi:RNA-directed DNA polymerase
VEWKDINWSKIQRVVFKLQKRIFRASQRGDVRAVRRLQKTLINSWSAKALAVRRVTQDNQGKRTAGVDGVKNLTPKQRLELINQLRLNRRAKPTRRVWIPKPGRKEKRPLGIPTMYDRATQALVKAALEPEWEARFEENSFGFRPGRSALDAIEAIFLAIKQKDKYVLDADIAKCFDKINHKALLEKLNTSPTIRRQIKAWLKAGVIDWSGYANRNKKKVFSQTLEGTPQGGVISPLLANIALHGLENRLKQYAETLMIRDVNGNPYSKVARRKTLSLIRYADDFVILHESKIVVQKCKQITEEWLKGIGLELKPEKTRISHTLRDEGNGVGFKFLGFTIKQVSKGRYTSGKDTQGRLLGFKTIITPSKENIKEHIHKVGSIINSHNSAPKRTLIAKLNPVIKGWCNYYSSVVSKKIFSKIDNRMWEQLRGWAKYRHKNKKAAWKEWEPKGTRNWVFSSGDYTLLNHASTPIVRHTKVQGERSPFDGDWVYWSNRQGKYPGTKKQVSTLLRKQKGKCSHCGLYFTSDCLIEIHHKDKNRRNNKADNLTIVHRHCHDVIHAMWESKESEMRSDESQL